MLRSGWLSTSNGLEQWRALPWQVPLQVCSGLRLHHLHLHILVLHTNDCHYRGLLFDLHENHKTSENTGLKFYI